MIYPAVAKLFPPAIAVRLARYAARLQEIARQEDLELLEINPLALAQDDSLVVCDAKLVRDERAAFRHDADEFPTSRMLREQAMTPLERSARQLGFQLTDLAPRASWIICAEHPTKQWSNGCKSPDCSLHDPTSRGSSFRP